MNADTTQNLLELLVGAGWVIGCRKTQKRLETARKEAKKQHEKPKVKYQVTVNGTTRKFYSEDAFNSYIARSVNIPDRNFVAPPKPKPRVEDFRGYCTCPNCNQFALHWIGRVYKHLVDRECRQCEFHFRQIR